MAEEKPKKKPHYGKVPGKRGRKKGGHNAEPTFRKPRGEKKITAKKSASNTKGLRPPWKPGHTGNPKGRPKGSGTVDIHKVFMTLLEREGKEAGIKYIDEIFYKLLDDVRRGARKATAARTLLAWGVGMPTQMVRVNQGVDITIGVDESVDSMDLEKSDNVTIDFGEEKKDV